MLKSTSPSRECHHCRKIAWLRLSPIPLRLEIGRSRSMLVSHGTSGTQLPILLDIAPQLTLMLKRLRARKRGAVVQPTILIVVSAEDDGAPLSSLSTLVRASSRAGSGFWRWGCQSLLTYTCSTNHPQTVCRWIESAEPAQQVPAEGGQA